MVSQGFSRPSCAFCEHQLHQTRHRYYNNAQGRFTQQDDMTKVADTNNGNRYVYEACNALN
jgi:RHS repeat-associated protein